MKQKLLLFDSIGALFSAISIYVVTQFEVIFGISQPLCQLLIPFPILFSIYSLLAYFFSKENWPKYLRIIALTNILYCCLTTVMMIIHYEKLTFLGLSYFIVEILIVTGLAFYEFKIANYQN